MQTHCIFFLYFSFIPSNGNEAMPAMFGRKGTVLCT